MTPQDVDVVVVGSGGAGLVAALAAAHRGLSTVVVEKAPHFGGSTARSGGGVWIPNNEVLERDGVRDTVEAARTYLHGIVGDKSKSGVEPERIDTYLDRGPEMLSFVLEHTPLKMCWVPGYSDYYPEAPGGRPRGRSIEPKPFDARKLGPDEAGLEPAYGKVPLNVVVMQQDYVRLNQLKRHPRGVLRSVKVGVRTMWAKATGKNLVGMGRALIGPLRIGLQQAGVPVELNTALTDSATADGDFAAWATDLQQSCNTSTVTQNQNYQAGLGVSQTAQNDKQTFLDTWNPIAQQYGQETLTASDI